MLLYVNFNFNFRSDYFPSIKVKQSRYRPGVVQKVPGGLGSHISWHSALKGGDVVKLMHRPPLPPEMFLILLFTRGWVDPRAMVRSKGNMSLKNPVTPLGIDHGTVRLVAQRLNHYATPGPLYCIISQAIYLKVSTDFKHWCKFYGIQYGMKLMCITCNGFKILCKDGLMML